MIAPKSIESKWRWGHFEPRFDMEKRLLKVGDVAREAGLTRQQIHMYSMMGLISPAKETPGGHRLFEGDDENAVERIEHQ